MTPICSFAGTGSSFIRNRHAPAWKTSGPGLEPYGSDGFRLPFTNTGLGGWGANQDEVSLVSSSRGYGGPGAWASGLPPTADPPLGARGLPWVPWGALSTLGLPRDTLGVGPGYP